ncbi:MAG: TerB N-terminal domain-containing protein [Clostridia bacterium]|nr:TerB N-terminal domain-containing protein [Clostridia bacterium]
MSFDKDMDDFWDIEKLVPKKKQTLTPFATNKGTALHVVSGEADTKNEENKLTFSDVDKRDGDVVLTYESDSSLIKRVTVKKNIDKYDFYSTFRKAALVYYDFKTPRADFAPYYSYMPQYSQLTSAQKNYYFFWRDEVRHGRFVKSDYSYLYLYVYEILNLPDKFLPMEALEILLTLWREYRESLPKIDPYFAVWVQDFCLVYNLKLDTDKIGNFLYEVVASSDFKEFYLSDILKSGIRGTETMLYYLSDYDFRRGRYAASDKKDAYKRHTLLAMSFVFDRLFSDGYSIADSKVTKIKRAAFPHSLCTHAVKCTLEIEYVSLSGDDALRKIVTESVRYTENKLRALLGVKSRLGIKELPDEYKRIIDRYFDGLFERERARIARENLPEYERLYDAPSQSLSFEDAERLEQTSWQTTARLVEEEEMREEPVTADVIEPVTQADEGIFGLSLADIRLLSVALESGFSDDAAAERINEAASDGFGDVLLEFDGEKYTVIDDYREEVSAWLSK